MAILTTIAIITGITVAVGTGITVGAYFATEDDRIRAEIAELEQKRDNCDTIITSFNGLKTKLNEGKSYLTDAKNDFTNGGHVLDGVPLANEEFTACNNKINGAITNINTIISDLTETKKAAQKKINELRAKL